MPRENDTVSGSENSIYAELAGEGPGRDQTKSDKKRCSRSSANSARDDGSSIGRQEAQATIISASDEDIDADLESNEFTNDFHSNFESISNVDREPLNGGTRDSNWKDRRYLRAGLTVQPHLEDGAD